VQIASASIGELVGDGNQNAALRENMLVYDKNRDIHTIIPPEHLKHARLVKLIQSRGIIGAKGYFNATRTKGQGQDNLVINSDLLASQPW
jgi:hypothetical protein